MRITETDLNDVLVVEPKIYEDHRGYFYETYQLERYSNFGIKDKFVQDNISFSNYGVLRGLHYQTENPQGKLVYVLDGEIFDVAVDIRKNSSTFGKWVSSKLSSKNKRQFWVPAGFAHGFCVTSKSALVSYKCTDYYNSKCEVSIKWDDPTINIKWPINNPKVSEKDQNGFKLEELTKNKLL